MWKVIFQMSCWIITVLSALGALTFRGRSFHIQRRNIHCSSSPECILQKKKKKSATICNIMSLTRGQKVSAKSLHLPLTKQIKFLVLCRHSTQTSLPQTGHDATLSLPLLMLYLPAM